MFGILNNLTKAALGVVFSPVSLAADILTLGGSLEDRDEPYTVSSVRGIMRNLELAVDPDKLSDAEVMELIVELNRKK